MLAGAEAGLSFPLAQHYTDMTSILKNWLTLILA